MSHIACNSKNSYAIDKEFNLYSWGSFESGLLVKISETDQTIPKKIIVKNDDDEYLVTDINSGEFHVAAIGKRIKKSKKEFSEVLKEMNFAKGMFNEIKTWFYEHIKIYNVNDFICLMIRKNLNDNNIKYYEEFQRRFLDSFFSYLKLHKRDYFHMEEAFKHSFEEFVKLSQTGTFSVKNLEKLNECKIPKVKELYEYANKCYSHFVNNPRDFQFFARMVFKYKSMISEKDVRELFLYKYGNSDEEEDVQDESKLNNFVTKIMNVLMDEEEEDEDYESEENEIKKTQQNYLIDANMLIDCILEYQTGMQSLFTWGIYNEGRLGYDDKEDLISSSNNNEILIQPFPKLVSFPDNVKIVQVSCGFYHTLARSEFNYVYAWGSSKYGCLGKYTNENLYTPTMIQFDKNGQKFSNIKQIAAGMYLSLALNEKGEVFSWGLGNNGRLGHGNENSVEKPKLIEYFNDNDIKIKQISCGDLHCACISTNKELFTFGNGNYGKLGHCNFDHVLTPTKVAYFVMQKVDNVVCGSYNTICITTDSKLYAWGKNSHGMLGIPHLQEKNILIPTEIQYQKDNADLIINEVALGSMHTMFLGNGEIYTCGNSINGVLGIENVFDKIVFPKKVDTKIGFFDAPHSDIMKKNEIFKEFSSEFTLDLPYTKFSTGIIYTDCSAYNSAFITNNRELYMCGLKKLIPENEKVTANNKQENEDENDIFKNVNDEDSEEYQPNNYGMKDGFIHDKFLTYIDIFQEKVSYISLGKDHCIAIVGSKPYSWGSNEYGKCGITIKATNEFITKPTLIDSIKTNCKMCAVSDTNSFVLSSNGEIYGFGNNMYGKLGTGDLNKYFSIDVEPMESEPVMVKNITVAQFIACSNTHSACIMKYNNNLQDSYSVYTWGSGFNGKLGHGNRKDFYEPKIVNDLEMKLREDLNNKKLYYIKVACGEDFTLILDECGKLWGCGKSKFLPHVQGIGNDGKIDLPVLILEKFKFKYISARGNLASAITMNGEIYCWGEMIIEDTVKKIDFAQVSNERMKICSVGFNHCVSVDEINHPYSWGSNLYNKCGYENVVPNKIEIVNFPKRIEVFYETFSDNEEILIRENEENKKKKNKDKKKDDEEENEEIEEEEEEINTDASSRLKSVKKLKKNEIQLKLLDEPKENKDIGLLIQDIKINEDFFKVIREFFKSMQNLQEKKTKLFLDTEDKIESMINLSKCQLTKKYVSNVPLIISNNFQIYEAFVQIIYNHPCYLEILYNNLQNPKTFLEIVKILYGKNILLLNDQRIIMNLLGLWNCLFESFNLAEREYECRETIIYYLYEILFEISKENKMICIEIISYILLYIITFILEKVYVDLNKEAEHLISHYKKLSQNENIKDKIKEIIENYLNDKYNEIKENSSFSLSVLWIQSRFVKNVEKHIKNQEANHKKLIKKLNLILNYLIFEPTIKLLNKIIESNSNNLPLEFDLLVETIPEVLMKTKTKNLFSKLYNDYNVNPKKIKNIFKDLCDPHNEILIEILGIIKNFCNYNEINVEKRIPCLKSLDFDFTLNAVKNITKFISENGNESMTIPITISNLILLQTNFSKILMELDQNDPLKIIINNMNDFNIDELDSTSSINNNVLNMNFNVYDFYFNYSKNVDMIKCTKCMLPIPDIFFNEKQKNDCINGPNWKCPKCEHENSGDVVECPKCFSTKTKKIIKNNCFYFKKYYIKNTELVVRLFEKVLYILPPMDSNEDIKLKIANKLIELKENVENSKEKEENKKILEDFLKILPEIKENMVNLSEKEIFENLRKKVEENLEKRFKHVAYLTKIRESLNVIKQFEEGAKSKYVFLEKKIQTLRNNIGKGFISQYFIQFNRMIPYINREKSEKKSLSKVFLVQDLINQKVIHDILFEKKKQPKLVQKSYLEIEKKPKGYLMKLSYKEKIGSLIVCGQTKHNYQLNEYLISNRNVRNLRKIARHNPVIEFDNFEISFNTFYLVILLNSLCNQ